MVVESIRSFPSTRIRRTTPVGFGSEPPPIATGAGTEGAGAAAGAASEAGCSRPEDAESTDATPVALPPTTLGAGLGVTGGTEPPVCAKAGWTSAVVLKSSVAPAASARAEVEGRIISQPIGPATASLTRRARRSS